MAYDSLKALIRQYIKTNGEQEITGQILQNVLVEMVNQYPSTDGFATQSWVTSQGYATTSQLADYLPLTGGTLTGNLTVLNANMSVVTAGSSNTSYTTIIRGPGIEAQMMSSGTPIYRMVLDYSGLTFYDNDVAGTTITRSSITSGSFIKSGGTSSQFLKADGSVDSNTYVTSSVLSGYLPLTGGTLHGVLFFADENGQAVRGEIFGDEFGLSIQVAGYGILSIENKIETDNTIKTEGFIKRGGTSAQFLKADGSVDSNTYLTSAALADYLPLTGGNISGNLTVNGTGYFSNTFTVQSIELGHSNEINSLSDGLYNLHLNYRVSGNVSICHGGGNCGIGTIDPSYKLNVNGSANATTLYENGTSLSNKYLALTGGTLTGYLFFSSNGINRGEVFGDEYGLNIQVSGQGKLLIENAIEANSTIKTDGFIKNGGTSAQFLKADGSVDSNTYITASALTGYATQSWVTTQLGSYNPTSNFKTINNQSIIGTGNINIEGGGGGANYDAEVEYLESTGTQWIDTGYTFSGTSKREFKVVFLSSGLYGFCYGANSNGNEVLLGTTESYLNGANFASIALNTLYEITIDCTTGAASCVINGVTKATSQSSPNNGAELLFAVNNFGNNNNNKWRLYYYKIYNNNVLVRDFIPVRVGNVGYLYDKVSGELFGNSGTGDFVLGQDTGPGGGLPYLPLTGGTITGNLTVNGTVRFNNNLTFAYDKGIYFGNDNICIKRNGYRLLIVNEASDDIIIGDYNNSNSTSIVNDLQGCTANSAYIVGSPTWFIRNDGTAQFKSVSQTSDLRKKTIIGDVPMNIYNVANAPLFKFTWNDETKYSGQHIGSAAQYWQTVLPELVSIGRDAEMTLAMQYDVIALASAITVAKTVVNHEERIILLERENEALKKEIADLKSA